MSTETLARALQIDLTDEGLPEPSWNVKPTQTIPVVTGSHPERRLTPARWSLVPPWADDLKLPYPTFNARVETAADKPTFRASVASKRCIVPFDGYYEWHTENGVKSPYYIRRSDSAPLALAGLYSWWRKPGSDEWHLTATILTRDSAGPIAQLHDRMPVLVHPDLIIRWLDNDVVGDGAMLRRVSESGLSLLSDLKVDAVAPLRGDGPELIEPLTESS